jgi:hypothetical protein
MLPEDRSRHLQELLGGISHAAKSTGELVTDTKSYPAVRSYSCNVPSFATVEGDVMTIALPDFYTPLFPLTGVMRETPMCLDAKEGDTVTYSVTFPAGYTEIEHLPKAYAFRSIFDYNTVWYGNDVSCEYDADGRLVVKVSRTRGARNQTVISPDYCGMLKDWSRIGSSRSNRTIVVRRRK